MKAEELRIGNLLMTLKGNSMPTGAIIEVSEIVASEIGAENLGVGKGISATIFISHLSYFEPIPLTEEWLKKFGFESVPHFTLTNSQTIDIGRDRQISIGCVGTPNLMVWLQQKQVPMPIELICLHNYDYDGEMHVHQLQNLYFALTREELTIQE